MKTEQKTKVHFTDNYLLSPTNPIEVNLIGARGYRLKSPDRPDGNEPLPD